MFLWYQSTVEINFFSKSLDGLNFNFKWIGKGLNEKAIDLENKKVIIKINKKHYRPTEVEYLKGDYKKASKELKWYPKTNIKELVKIMLDAEKILNTK